MASRNLKINRLCTNVLRIAEDHPHLVLLVESSSRRTLLRQAEPSAKQKRGVNPATPKYRRFVVAGIGALALGLVLFMPIQKPSARAPSAGSISRSQRAEVAALPDTAGLADVSLYACTSVEPTDAQIANGGVSWKILGGVRNGKFIKQCADFAEIWVITQALQDNLWVTQRAVKLP